MSYLITLRPFGVEFECGERETVLQAALRSGVALRYGCKHGGCGSCKVKLGEGDVEYARGAASAISEAEQDAGLALLCCAYPTDDLAVELADDYTQAELTPRYPIGNFTARLAQAHLLTHDTMQVVLEIEGDRPLSFGAGQFIEIAPPGLEQWRAYSMANPPSAGNRVELMTKLLPGGVFSTYLQQQAGVGDVLQLRGPFGQFQIAETAAPIIMVAGGSGMAPIVAMLADLADRGCRRDIVFYYGARSRRDLFYSEEMAALGRRLGHFRFVPALSEPLPSDDWRGETGLITAVIERTSDSLRPAEGYLCGPPGMIDAAVAVLRAKGMFASRIKYDKFLSTAP